MEIVVNSPKEWLREITVEIEPQRLQSRIDGLLEQYRDRAEVPGFRRGRVPKEILKRRFGSALESAAVEELVEEALSEVLKEHNVKPASRVQFEDLEIAPDKTVRFRASVEVIPDFELKPYTGLNLRRTNPTGFDAEFEKRLQALREKCALFHPVQRPAQSGDFLVVDYLLLENDQPVAGPKTNITIRVGDEGNHPEVNQALLNATSGEQRQVTIAFPADHQDKNIAGREITYRFTVRAVKERILPEVTEEFAQDLGFENLDSLRQNLNDEILADRQEQIEEDLKRQAIDRLLAEHDFEPPQSWVDAHIARLRQEFNLPDTPETREKLLPIATRSARWDCIVMRIAAQENITVTDEEIQTQIEQLATDIGRTPQEVASLVDNASYRFLNLQKKVLRLILDQAKITE